MAKRKTPPRPELPQPVLRAWHVVTTSGADVTVTAHHTEADSGVLAFYRFEDIPGFDTRVVVRAFGAGAWHDVEMVDVPADVEPES
jgi:hypothetical protein